MLTCQQRLTGIAGKDGIGQALMMFQLNDFIASDRPKVALIDRTEQIRERRQERILPRLIDKLVEMRILLTSEALLYSTENATQYSVMIHTGKESEKEWVCVHV